jgi:hypothetical protein
MTGSERVSELIQKTMDDFDAPDMSVSALARRCHRIAALRGDRPNMFWLSLELSDLTLKPEGIVDKTLAQREFEKVPAEDRGAFFAKGEAYSARRVRPDGNMYGASIEQAERMLSIATEEVGLISRVPDGMHPQDLGLRLLRMDEPVAKINEIRRQFEHTLSVTRSALWEFLVETEWALTFGEASAETFDRLRTYVDQQLSTISPPALEQFQAAYRRLKDGGDEDRAHALTSCRRVLKTLADELYPPRAESVEGIDGKPHDVGEPALRESLGAVREGDRWEARERGGGSGGGEGRCSPARRAQRAGK